MANVNNFRDLDRLIHSGEKEIKLEGNMGVDMYSREQDEYPEGILIDVDGITIDGNGYGINALGQTRIFKITSKNVTIKNITLRLGYSDESGGAIYNEGSVTFIKTKFINNIARSQGGAIHNVAGAKIKLEKCKLRKNQATKEGFTNAQTGVRGGAILNQGIFDIADSCIQGNFAVSATFPTISSAGAICNLDGEMKIVNTKLNYNASLIEGYEFNYYIYGGLIVNHGQMTLERCDMKNNESGKNIISNLSQMNIFNCEIEDNSLMFEGYGSEMSAIISNDHESNRRYDASNLTIANTNVTNNKATNIIINKSKSSLSIVHGKICDNESENAVLIHGESCNINGTEFENGPINIANHSTLFIKNPVIADRTHKSIVNHGKMIIVPLDLDEIIDNHGIVKPGVRNRSNNDFTKLNDLICKNKEEKIVLNHDYSIEEYEIDYFEGGIDLDVDGLTIDGQNHTLDGKNLSRIFVATAKDITLENIIFKNGLAIENYRSLINSCGGAIRINYGSGLRLINCRFENNDSENHGGAISNSGILDIESGDMVANHALHGGAIDNWGEMDIQNTKINANGSKIMGGAIYNMGKITAEHITLKENVAGHSTFMMRLSRECNGGAIYNGSDGNLSLTNSKLLENRVATDKDDSYDCHGGAISNFGVASIISSAINDNSTELGEINSRRLSKKNTSHGGAIDNCGDLTIKCTNFTGNKSISGGAINNKGTLSIERSEFNENITNGRYMEETINLKSERIVTKTKIDPGSGGAINNMDGANSIVDKVILIRNTADYGGAISNNGEISITNSELVENQGFRQGGAIYADGGTAQITDSKFISNDAGNGLRERKIYSDEDIKAITQMSMHYMSHAILYNSRETIYLNGGAVWSGGNGIKLERCEFKDNTPDDVHYDNAD